MRSVCLHGVRLQRAATGANLPVASLSGGLILEEAICLLCPDIPSANNTEKAFTI